METARPYNLSIIVAGVWLFASALLWHHTTPQLVNAVVVGLASVLLGALARQRTPNGRFARYLELPIAAWLFLSSWILPGSALTVANHLTVASWLMGIAMLPVEANEEPTGDTFPT